MILNIVFAVAYLAIVCIYTAAYYGFITYWKIRFEGDDKEVIYTMDVFVKIHKLYDERVRPLYQSDIAAYKGYPYRLLYAMSFYLAIISVIHYFCV